MTAFICNTSPLQYLYQLNLLNLLPALMGKIIVPTAVVEEVKTGKENGIDLPDLSLLDWIEIREPASFDALLHVRDLGAGETAVLALALESNEAVVILDDALARRTAEKLNLRLIGTLGVLLNAKNKNLITEIAPILERLDSLRFRLAAETKEAVLKLAGEKF